MTFGGSYRGIFLWKELSPTTAESAGDYDELKKAILRRYQVNEETHRVRFRQMPQGGDKPNTGAGGATAQSQTGGQQQLDSARAGGRSYTNY